MDLELSAESTNTQTGVAKVFIAPVGDFLVQADLTASPTNQGDKVTISGNHTFTSPKGWQEVFASPFSKTYEADILGDEDNKSIHAKVKIFIPGKKKEVAAFIKDNPKFIVLVQNVPCQDAEYYQVGSKCAPAVIAAEGGFKSGTMKDGKKGYEITLECYQPCEIFYGGTVTMSTE